MWELVQMYERVNKNMNELMSNTTSQNQYEFEYESCKNMNMTR
jgi:hypothetical protein